MNFPSGVRIGQIRYAAEIRPDNRGVYESFETMMTRYRRVRFKRGRVGWQWEAYEAVPFPNYPTRLEALRVARRHIKQLYKRLPSEQRP